jgi:Winged helix DNA-binding domain
VRNVKAAIADLGLVDLGGAEGLLALPEDAAAFADFTAPDTP